MIVSIQSSLVTNGIEERVSDNNFSLTIEGYQCFSIDQIINVKKQDQSNSFGKAMVSELTWKNGYTHIIYRLVSLNSVN